MFLQATKAYRKNERGEEMKKKCGSYFDAITKKIIRIIDYLSVIKLCIEKLDHNFKVIDIRLTKVEMMLDKLPKGTSNVKYLIKNNSEDSTKNTEEKS